MGRESAKCMKLGCLGKKKKKKKKKKGTTSIDNGQSSLRGVVGDKVFGKGVVEVAGHDGAQPGETRISIRSLHDLVLGLAVLFRRRIFVARPRMSSASVRARVSWSGEEVWDLKCSHDVGGAAGWEFRAKFDGTIFAQHF